MIDASTIIVLDFDNTITREHTTGCALPHQITETFIKTNTKPGFTHFIKTLADNNIPFYIATYGDDNFKAAPNETAGYALIKKYMDVLFEHSEKYFYFPEIKNKEIASSGNVIARFSMDHKKYHLNYLVKWANISKDKLSRVLFIDDDKDNLKYWHKKGCRITHDTLLDSADFARSEVLFNKLLPLIKSN